VLLNSYYQVWKQKTHHVDCFLLSFVLECRVSTLKGSRGRCHSKCTIPGKLLNKTFIYKRERGKKKRRKNPWASSMVLAQITVDSFSLGKLQ
jgi:hypothetical protein